MTATDVHRFTVEEFERSGVDDAELIDGIVYDASLRSVLHLQAVEAMYQLLCRRFEGRRILSGCGIRLDGRSLVGPDVLVADGLPPDGWLSPDRVLVVVEVSISTWARDTGVKLDAYAGAGIAEYWVVDPRPGGRLIRHTEPDGGTYLRSETTRLRDGLASFPA